MKSQIIKTSRQHRLNILDELLEAIEEIDFKEIVYSPYYIKMSQIDSLIIECMGDETRVSQLIKKRNEVKKELKAIKINKQHLVVIVIRYILNLAKKKNWGICKFQGIFYLYNGEYWGSCDKKELQRFFGKAAEKMGIIWKAKYHGFHSDLFMQFIAEADLPKPEQTSDNVLINLLNGTFEIGPDRRVLRAFDRSDFLTYQLPFRFDPSATAPLFLRFLNRVLPDISSQRILAEYFGYLFLKNRHLKLEKVLFLFGTGANGKSVLFEIVSALLGKEKVSNYSLQSLTDPRGYERAKLADTLVNYASEISGKLGSSIFKQLASGEPVEARLPYTEPYIISDYAKLVFNSNEMPSDAEQTDAFFRRHLIIPFEVTIPESEQDKSLAQKIIKDELSGVFNWILEGLDRLLIQKTFTHSEKVANQLKQYRKESDSVQMFLEDENYEASNEEFVTLSTFFLNYKTYCNNSGYRTCSKKSLSQRLKNVQIRIERKNYGMVVYVKRKFTETTLSSRDALNILLSNGEDSAGSEGVKNNL